MFVVEEYVHRAQECGLPWFRKYESRSAFASYHFLAAKRALFDSYVHKHERIYLGLLLCA